MRKAQKQEMLEMVQTLHQAHDEIKNNIVNVLSANYGISEAQARELLQNEDEITYTKSLNHIIMGDMSDLVSNSDMMQKSE